MNNNLLISEPPLQVLPSLAVKIGLNEAIILQQFHYWLQRSKNIKDGRKWIYNSYSDWNKQFPFWGRNTLRRALSSLEKQNLIVTGNYNKAKFDQTKWYSINYQTLAALDDNSWANDLPKMGKGGAQNGQMEKPKMGKPIPIDYQETTQEINNNNMSGLQTSPDHTDIDSVIDYLNHQSGKHYHHTATNRNLIKARLKDGFSIKDCKTVIYNQCIQWLHTDYDKYLRPQTLFRASKFEGYLNQSSEQLKKEKISAKKKEGYEDGISW